MALEVYMDDALGGPLVEEYSGTAWDSQLSAGFASILLRNQGPPSRKWALPLATPTVRRWLLLAPPLVPSPVSIAGYIAR